MDFKTLIPNDKQHSRDVKLISRGSIFFFIIGLLTGIFWLYRLNSNHILIYSVIMPLLFLTAGYLGRTVQKNSTSFLVIIFVILILGLLIFLIILTIMILTFIYCSGYNCGSNKIIFIFWGVLTIIFYCVVDIVCIFLIRAISRYRKHAVLVY